MIKVTVIGGGNVAFHLCKAFYFSNKVVLNEIYSRSTLSAHFSIFKNVSVTNTLHSLKESDVYIISVSDDFVVDVASQLPFTNKLVVHTTGSVSMGQLPAKNKRGVFYPLQTFSKNKDTNLQKVPFCIEAEKEADLLFLKELASCVSANVYEINSEQRKSIHLSAVFVNNFTNHLYYIAKDLSDDKNIPFDIFVPLIEETVDKLKQLSPYDAQTGPARRNDAATIETHVAQLQHNAYKTIYELLTQSITNTYERKEL